jgi:hypothetical protein
MAWGPRFEPADAAGWRASWATRLIRRPHECYADGQWPSIPKPQDVVVHGGRGPLDVVVSAFHAQAVSVHAQLGSVHRSGGDCPLADTGLSTGRRAHHIERSCGLRTKRGAHSPAGYAAETRPGLGRLSLLGLQGQVVESELPRRARRWGAATLSACALALESRPRVGPRVPGRIRGPHMPTWPSRGHRGHGLSAVSCPANKGRSSDSTDG